MITLFTALSAVVLIINIQEKLQASTPPQSTAVIAKAPEVRTQPHKTKAKKPVCSDEFMRDYYKLHHHLPEEVAWKGHESFEPKACRIAKANIRHCLLNRKIHQILILGDSNGHRYASALQSILQTNNIPCKQVLREQQNHRLPSLAYYTRGNLSALSGYIAFEEHQCGRCISTYVECELRGSEKVFLEYIGVESFSGKQITRKDLNTTFLEFVFEEYLKQRSPDVILFFIPQNHMKHMPRADFATQFGAFLRMYKNAHNMSGSRIYFMTGSAEKSPLTTNLVNNLNKEAYRTLESDLLRSDSKMHMFFNSVGITSKIPELMKDCCHYDASWYWALIQSWLRAFCHSKY